MTLSLGDIVESLEGSSAAVPLSEGLLHYLIWWAVDAPFALYGAFMGFKRPLAIQPNFAAEKRAMPKTLPWHLRRWAIVGLYGPVIFATVCFEFEYIMDSVWRSYMIYGMFVVLFISLVLLGLTIASLSIVITYNGLCHHNCDWWWNSFCLGASGGVYMFAYSLYYLAAKEDYSLLGGDFVYLLIMVLASYFFAFMCGSISVLSSYLFVEKMYKASSLS